MDAFAQSVIDFINETREWAFWIALVFAAAETTALVSILIPSTVILIGVGSLVATGALSFWPIWAGAAVGRHDRVHVQLVARPPLWRRDPADVAAARPPRLCGACADGIRPAGEMAIVLGHFIGPLRPVIFVMCGMAPMTLSRFLPWNAAGGIAMGGGNAPDGAGGRVAHRLALGAFRVLNTAGPKPGLRQP